MRTIMEGTLNKLAFVATAAVAALCAVALIATPADAKKRKRAPAPRTDITANAGGLEHHPGGPIRSGRMCWKEPDTRGMGYWAACPK
jgi:hypothetical protein